MKIDHRIWTAASATAVVTTNLITDYLTTVAASPIGQKIARFSYARGSIKIKIVIQGQPFAAGQIVASFIPVNTSANFGDEITLTHKPLVGYVNSKIVPHLILDPSKTETYEISLPVLTPSGVWNLRNGAGSYQMNLYPFNPLTSGTATAPTVSICTYMSFEDPSFEGLTLLSSPFNEESKPQGTLSALAQSVSAASKGIASAVPFLAPGLTLFSEVAGTAGKVLSWFGFSKPQALENQLFVMNRHVDNYSQYDGKSTAIVLAGTQANSLGLTSTYGGGKDDELLFSTLTKKRGLVYQFLATQAMAAEAVIGSLPINPALVFSPAASYYEPTPTAGISHMFKYWTGDIQMTFEFVSSVFHRGTFMVAWDPKADSTTAVPSFTDALQTLQNVTVSTSGNECVEIYVPWRQPVPWLPCNLVFSASQVDSDSNGRLYLYVVNPITANGSTDGIYINVYLSSDNIRFAVPDVDKVQLLDVADELLASPVFCPETKASFGRPVNLDGVELRAYGESYHNLKQVTSKLTTILSVTKLQAAVDTATHIQLIVPNYPFPVFTVGGGSLTGQNNNMLTWVASAFLGYRGSMRWVLHTHPGSNSQATPTSHLWTGNTSKFNQSAIFPAPTLVSGIAAIVDDYAMTLQNRALGPNAEVVAPMLFPYDYFPSRQKVSQNKNDVVFACSITKATADTSIKQELLSASGDDANFVLFLGFPTLK